MSNAVGALQELTVKKGIPLPIYTFEDITEPSLPSRFKCQGTCYGVQFSTIASSKKAAKLSTATLLLERISSLADLAESDPWLSAVSNSSINQMNDANGSLQKNTVDNGAGPSSLVNNKHPISLLQEYTVVHGLGYPKYEFRNLTQPLFGSQFECYGTCGNDIDSRAIASSKSEAKLKVAENMYLKLHRARESCSSISVSPIIEKSKSDGMLLPNPKETESIDLKRLPNAIGYLQEYTIHHGIPIPRYYFKQVNESSMCIKFMCTAMCGTISVSKMSTSKTDAKLQAAQAVLSELLNIPLSSGPPSICSEIIDHDDQRNSDSSDNESGNIDFETNKILEKASSDDETIPFSSIEFNNENSVEIKEPLNTQEESLANGLKTSPNSFYTDYVAEIKVMLNELQDLGIEYRVIQTSVKPCVMYFCHNKSGRQEISRGKIGFNPLLVKYKLLKFELNKIKNQLD